MAQAGPLMYPGQSNTYVKSHEASNYLMTQFSRNVNDFAINQYVQYQPITKDSGYYLRINVQQAGRLKDGRLDQFHWPDKADRPIHHDSNSAFNWVDFRSERYAFPCTLGWKSKEQAGFDLEDVELKTNAQKSMTARTLRVHDALENNSLWDASHIEDVTGISGNTGRWDQSTTGRSDIKRSLNYAHTLIQLHTLSVVKKKSEMQLVMNPNTARKISETQELINAVIQSRHAMEHFRNDQTVFDDYGLPKMLYGFKVVVEDAAMVTSPRGAVETDYDWVCEDGVAYLLSRPGGLVAKSAKNTVSYSTIMCFTYEDMTAETLDDKNNRRTQMSIVDDTAEELTAPVSGFKFENVC